MPVYQDESGRAAGPRTLKVRGSIVAVALAVLATVLYQGGSGEYDKTFRLTVVTDVVGEGLAPGAEVKLHGLTIGSVKTLASAGFGKQRMTVALDPKQARALTIDTEAKFTSSNIFGTAAVELVSDGTGPRLPPNRTLEISGDTEAASVTGVMRQMQQVSSVLDTREFNTLFALLRKHADLTAPTIKTLVDTSKMVSDALTVPFSKSLSVIASFISGFNDFIPMFSMVNELLDRLDFIAAPGGGERAVNATAGFTLLLRKATEGFAENMDWVIPLITTLYNIFIPTTYALGSLAPAYDRLSGLIDRTGAAFRVENNKVRVQIQVILDTAPGLAAAVTPSQATGSAPEPATAGSAPAQAPSPPVGGAR